MSEDSSTKKSGSPLIVIIVLGFVIYLAYAALQDSSRNDEVEITNDPSRLAYLLLDYADESFQSSAQLSGKELIVTFNLGEYSPASEITFLEKAKYVCGKFHNRFKDNDITLVGSATFTDIKGQKAKEKAFSIKFSSEQAKTINWENVQYSNLPALSQEYWKHQ